MKMNKQSFQQISEQYWAEDEASSAYYDTCLGWRHEHDQGWYDEHRNNEIVYAKEHLFKNEPDAADLVARFIVAWDIADEHYKNHSGLI